MAADELDEPHVLYLARDRGRRCLVQVAHPLLDIAGRNEREPVERQQQHLAGQVVELASDGESLGGQDECLCRVVRSVEHKARTKVGEHPVLVAERHVLQEVARTLEPAAGLGRAAEEQAVDRELESETRCSTIVAEVRASR